MAGSEHRLWTVDDLSEFLQVPVKTLYQWRSRGYGPKGRRVGKYVRYTEADVLAWIDSLGDTAAFVVIAVVTWRFDKSNPSVSCRR